MHNLVLWGLSERDRIYKIYRDKEEFKRNSILMDKEMERRKQLHEQINKIFVEKGSTITLSKVESIIRKKIPNQQDFEDCLQEVLYAVNKAKYNPLKSRGKTIDNFYLMVVDRKIKSFLKKNYYLKGHVLEDILKKDWSYKKMAETEDRTAIQDLVEDDDDIEFQEEKPTPQETAERRRLIEEDPRTQEIRKLTPQEKLKETEKRLKEKQKRLKELKETQELNECAYGAFLQIEQKLKDNMPDKIIGENLQKSLLQNWLKILTSQERKIYELYYKKEMSIRKVAKETGLSKKKIERILKKIKEKLIKKRGQFETQVE